MEFLRTFRWRQLLALGIITCIAIWLRTTSLGEVPHGLTWDEAAIGYNGYAIATTRRDEWLVRLPISFKSFGDYKAAVSIYIVGLITLIFDLSAWSVRLPFAILGSATVVLFYFFSYVLLENQAHRTRYALLAAAALAVSPWHIHFSRIAFETGMSLFFMLLGATVLLLVFKDVHTNKISILSWMRVLVSAVSFSLSLYAYHSAKIVVPLFLVLLIFLYFKSYTRKSLLSIVVFFAVLLGTLYPLLRESLVGAAATRAGVLFIFEPISLLEMGRLMISNVVIHIGPEFMIHGATDTLRHGPGAWSVLLPTTYFFCILGGLSFVWYLIRQHTKIPKYVWFAIGSTCIGLLPAALTREVPHANRALLALPGILLLASFGVQTFLSSLKVLTKHLQLEQQLTIRDALLGSICTLHIYFFVSFWNYYMTTFAAESAAAFQDGYIEAFTLAQAYERGIAGKPEVDIILVNSTYGQPYIYALFVRKTNPIWYQGGSLSKYLFVPRIQESDLSRENALLIAAPADGLSMKDADHLVYGSDGAVRFMLYYTGHNAL